VASTCEWGKERPGNIKSSEFHDWLRTCWFLLKDSVLWSFISQEIS